LRLFQRGHRGWLALIAIGVAAAAWPAAALGASGGLTPTTGAELGAPATASTPTPAETECTPAADGLNCAPVTSARLVLGAAIPPTSAPEAVKAAISAANLIRTKPYVWGGGHAHWYMSGYDCSGAVSFALHGAGLITTSMDSGEMMDWGAPGKGRWITIYANAGHAFAVIDGVRWDTVGDATGTGPRWHPETVSTAGYVARHPVGY
jgi:hypothetical protein